MSGLCDFSRGLAIGLIFAATPPFAESYPEPVNLTELAEQILAGGPSAIETTNGDPLIAAVLEPETGGLDVAQDRGFLRMAIAPDPLMIAFDGEEAVGAAIALAQEMEKYLAGLPGAPATPTVVVPTPMPRAQIADGIKTGRGDFTTLTITRVEEIDALDYTQALITDVNDVPVLGPDLDVSSIDDLVGIPIYLSENSRYAANAERLNDTRIAAGKEPLTIRYVDPALDDFDLIEMVEIGLIQATIATDFKANFWNTIYTGVVVRTDLPLTQDGRIAWAVRAENPQLQQALDGFAEIAREGTLLGNVILDRYASSADWIENLGTDTARTRIDQVGPVIRRYSEEYGFEPDLILAQAYQESRLDQSSRSHVGAIGVMQVMPTTAADPVVGIPDIAGPGNLENNVHAGVRYMRWLRDTFFDDPEITPLNQTLLAFAAYNAGPGGVARGRQRAVEMGLDPNVWFENVEIAIQAAVSREPAIYVRNIFKYYVSYRLLQELEEEAQAARQDLDALPDNIETLSSEERDALIEDALGATPNAARP
ncbi:transglycosylase SLT domain-containing protein [Aestuariibius sp. 2305UL40-4]|uniref:transglycosylase SLT domain-containing protein n=1 Tax=Aestuariibius violaceus TaxID=3234132 RepID=UPI00345EA586